MVRPDFAVELDAPLPASACLLRFAHLAFWAAAMRARALVLTRLFGTRAAGVPDEGIAEWPFMFPPR